MIRTILFLLVSWSFKPHLIISIIAVFILQATITWLQTLNLCTCSELKVCESRGIFLCATVTSQTQQNRWIMSQPPSQWHSVASFAPTWQSAPSWSMPRVTVRTCTTTFMFVADEMSTTTTGLEEQPVFKLLLKHYYTAHIMSRWRAILSISRRHFEIEPLHF